MRAAALITLTLPVIVLISVSPSLAQEVRNDDVISVKGRLTREDISKGIRAGGLMVYPEIGITQTYDDNIFRTDTGEQGDFITGVTPSLGIGTNWNLHEISLKAKGDFGFHADNGDENYEDYEASASGRYDITHETYLTGRVRHERLHEDRSSPDDADGDEPTEYGRTTAEAGFRRGLARLKLDLDARYRDFEFEDSQRGTIVVDNSPRDREEQRYGGKLAYEFIPNYEIYIRGRYEERNYDTQGAADRSSDGYGLSAGTDINISGKLKADIYGGYIERNFTGAFKDMEEENFGGSILWNVSGLTSLRADVDRQVIETVRTGTSGYLRTSSTLSLEHAFRRHLLLDAYGSYIEDDFIGTATTRKDETYRAGASIEYKMGRKTKLLIGYRFSERDTNSANSGYTNHRILTSLNLSY